MFSGFRSAWIKPKDFSFFKAVATSRLTQKHMLRSSTLSERHPVSADKLPYLLQDGPDDFQWQWAKFVLLKKVIKVLLQHFKNQTGVTAVLKALESTHHIVLVCILAAQTCKDLHLRKKSKRFSTCWKIYYCHLLL